MIPDKQSGQGMLDCDCLKLKSFIDEQGALQSKEKLSGVTCPTFIFPFLLSIIRTRVPHDSRTLEVGSLARAFSWKNSHQQSLCAVGSGQRRKLLGRRRDQLQRRLGPD
ncbi:unnamed protein product [Pleuronectes platessa]|uniref:Uncharacterized protein n=1 Tax=Pleuronectes platessa TaxID=8262 RepID=A0A9N7V6X9_PLEPL|nr:unnamed protein product [Pleuronectes platessa]